MKIIAVDFDGTLCENKYPEIGEPVTGYYRGWKGDKYFSCRFNFIKLLIALQEMGNKIILFTCRGGEQLEEAVSWCNNLFGLKFDAVNNDVEETLQRYAPTLELRNQLSGTRKIYADVYIDDRNLNADEYLEKNLILLDAKSLYDMGITENADIVTGKQIGRAHV